MSAFASMDVEAIQQLVLDALAVNNTIEDSYQFASTHNLDHQAVVGALKSLLVDRYAIDTPLQITLWALTAEGSDVAKNGSPEVQVFNAIATDGTSIAELNKMLPADIIKIGMGSCMKNKWVKKEGDLLKRAQESVVDNTMRQLSELSVSSSAVTEEDLKNLKRRKLVDQITRKYYCITKGPEYRQHRVKKFTDLTKDMLGNKDDMDGRVHWSNLEFKPINLKSMGAPVEGGSYHPLLKVRAEFRRILMEMGFEEMPTSKWVESSFWNFDALFQPQSHPARDAHDTFFIKNPEKTLSVPEDYYKVVKQTHENGGFGSIGYGYNFRRLDATTNLLRTHTTAVSAQMLYKMAKEFETTGVFTPKKYFSIDRVFRNEAMDATHLCEFHQVEGLIADRNLTLGNLRGIIKTFFEKIGITQLRFKPAYNPYTEPSMEIFGYHPDLKKWTEIGNSGMFRPEMLRPMGLPDDVRVIAWGLSLERPTMIKYRIENIRDLFGHKADLNKQRVAPIARF